MTYLEDCLTPSPPGPDPQTRQRNVNPLSDTSDSGKFYVCTLLLLIRILLCRLIQKISISIQCSRNNKNPHELKNFFNFFNVYFSGQSEADEPMDIEEPELGKREHSFLRIYYKTL